MDAIEALDEGAYAHFDLKAGENPDIVFFMQPAYYYSSYVGISVLFAIVMLLFLVQGRRRGALVALAALASAVALIQLVHILVPRPLPLNSDQWLGVAASGSYPSSAVFLFTLCLTLLGFALWDRINNLTRMVGAVLAAALIAWVCVGGFYLRLHHVTDVIGGLAGAALVGWIASRFMAEPPPPRRT